GDCPVARWGPGGGAEPRPRRAGPQLGESRCQGLAGPPAAGRCRRHGPAQHARRLGPGPLPPPPGPIRSGQFQPGSPMFARLLNPNQRELSSLDAREILSLASSAEEEDGAIYGEFAVRLRDQYPGTAAIFEGMAKEEDTHR